MGRPAVVVMVVNGSACYFIAFFHWEISEEETDASIDFTNNRFVI